MFKAIKEFFVGKPKQEASVEVPQPENAPVITEPVTTAELPLAPSQPVIELNTVTVSVTDGVDITKQPDTVTNSGAWPFPNTPPTETSVKKKRTFVKRQEPSSDKKPTPAIKVNKNKSRKKK